MPIYAYRCESCGFAKDVLQKISDAPLHVCPSCNTSAFRKQVTAAGFQLKGSGWYVTDFKGGASATSSNAAPADAPAPSTDAKSEPSTPATTTTPSTPSAAPVTAV